MNNIFTECNTNELLTHERFQSATEANIQRDLQVKHRASHRKLYGLLGRPHNINAAQLLRKACFTDRRLLQHLLRPGPPLCTANKDFVLLLLQVTYWKTKLTLLMYFLKLAIRCNYHLSLKCCHLVQCRNYQQHQLLHYQRGITAHEKIIRLQKQLFKHLVGIHPHEADEGKSKERKEKNEVEKCRVKNTDRR